MKVLEGFEESLSFNEQVLNTNAIKEFKNNGDEENRTDSGTIDQNMKKVTTNFEKSNENVLQNTVVKEIQNRVSDKTQDVNAECNKDGATKNIPSPFKRALI